MLMIGRARDQFEQWEEEGRDDTEDKWKKLLMKVQGYATRRRLEANYAKNKGDPMHITAANDNSGSQGEWSDDWGNEWDTGGYGNIDALGKAKGKGVKGKGKGDNKGKGKGKPSASNGQCYSCGEYGHSARFCPYGAGKSKGNGKEQTNSYNCGNSGHIAANCPKGKGKGAPMGQINPGKGSAGQWNIGAVQPAKAAVNNQVDTNQVGMSPLVGQLKSAERR